ncbi:MAG: hypothetical protein HC923_05925 [Myxococcales bacterium]|nr:hypothetical protein [Myxococcales bacterium]
MHPETFFDPSINDCSVTFADGELCESADKCVIDSVCSQGVCLGQSKTCTDASLCTRDLCRPSDGQCVFLEDESICDDDNPCTVDVCTETGCSHESLPNGVACDDGDECSLNDACFAGTCRGATLPNGRACNDGDSCTIDDRCTDGKCSGQSIIAAAEEGDIVFSYDLEPWPTRAFLHRREVALSRDGTLLGLDHLSPTDVGDLGLIHQLFALKQCGTDVYPPFSYRPADANSWVRYVRRAVLIDPFNRTRLIVGVRQLPSDGFRPETTSYTVDADGTVLSSAIRVLGGETGWSMTPDGSFIYGVILPSRDGPPPDGETVRDTLAIVRQDRDGQILWRHDRPAVEWAEFLGVAGPRVLFWSEGRFGALDFATGAPVWSRSTSVITKELSLSTQLDLGVAARARS